MIFKLIIKEACDVMAIIKGNEIGKQSSIPRQGCLCFNFTLIPLGKAWLHLFSLQQQGNSRADRVFSPWYGNQSRRRKNFKFKSAVKVNPVLYPAQRSGVGKIIIIIIIIINVCQQCWFLWYSGFLFSLSICPNQASFLIGLLDGIQCRHRICECKFLLVC